MSVGWDISIISKCLSRYKKDDRFIFFLVLLARDSIGYLIIRQKLLNLLIDKGMEG